MQEPDSTLKKIVLAQPRGVCAGVDRAIKIVELALARFGAPLYVRKEIVHNRFVVEGFRKQGVVFVEELDAVPDGATVIFSAHGVAPAVKSEAERRELRAIDATCPLVSKVHHEVLRYVKKDQQLVLIGHPGHDEVVGTMGHAPQKIHLVSTVAQAEGLELAADVPAVALTQTTLSMDDAAEIMSALAERFPLLEKPAADDICYATQNRQNAVKALVDKVQLLLVVGSQNSSNAARLVDVAQARGVRGALIDSAEEIEPSWLDDVEAVGVTSGASTPEVLVDAVLERLKSLSAREDLPVELCDTVDESVVFSLPKELEA